MDVGWVSACPPGDFEDHAALILSVADLLDHFPQTVVRLSRALVDRIALVLIVRGEEQRQQAIVLLADWGVPAHQVHFLFMPVGTWTRDFAPAFVRRSDGRVWILDADYPSRENQPNDDVVPAALSALLRVPRRRVPLALEGGNLLSNGRGLCLYTSALLDVNRMSGRRYDLRQVHALLDEWYGFGEQVMLEPLLGHRTLHVDMFATFVRPDVVLVGECDPATDSASAAALDRNAAHLAQVVTRGRPLRVERLPMPPFRDGVCRTYTNVIYANGRLLVPHYADADPGMEREVLATYAALLPGWDLAQVDCADLIRHGGALRCLSAHVPWLHGRFEHADRSGQRRTVPT